MLVTWRIRSLKCCCAAVFLCTLGSGCGDSQAKVSGQVLFDGKPLPGGWVTFCPTDSTKNSVTSALDGQGMYQATLPVGDVRIAIDNRELERPDAGAVKLTLPPGIKLPEGVKPSAPAPRPPDQANKGTAAESYVAIPEKYYDVDTSGLTYTVRSGSQSHKIELK